jgi:mono/diheme cytochrome c family protein
LHRSSRHVALIALLAASLAGMAASAADRSAKVDFARDVAPILSDNCFRCHGPDGATREAELRLDVPEGTQGPFAKREDYQIIVPGNLDDSVLIMRVTAEDDDSRMPPPKSNKKLTAEQIDVLTRWVAQGAPWGKHWAYEKPKRAEVPRARNSGAWPRNDVDRFILARLEEEGIEPSAPAEKHTLLRRAALDLTGLPPTPQELDAFIEDSSADAFEKQVDRLIASPHFGERQARHWLDYARYADSNGYSHDFPRSIWPYRDWVINAMNADMPFDQFTIEQLAGDMLPDATPAQKIATGFHRNTQINTEGGIDPEQFRIESVIDRVGTTATVFLGLTVACAQCHDHKFDPVSQKEFYQLFAFFNNADEPTLKVTGVTDPKEVDALKERVARLDAAVKQKVSAWELSLTDEQRKTLKPEAQAALAVPADKRDPKQHAAVQAALRSADNDFGAMADDLNAVKKQLSEGVTTLVMSERAKNPRKTHLFVKGDFTRLGDEVQPGVPAILHPLKTSPATTKPTRLDLARWITDGDNPLTARVVVNRIWQQYFGRGIVETENDFGSQGIAPTHPELLDFLATELIANKWSLKHIHRLIVTSATYRQSSNARPDLDIKDPYNKRLARQSRMRLDAEIVRDVALVASGLLHEKIGGPSVFPPVPDGVMGLGQVKHEWRESKGANRHRRGMYTFTFRNSLHPSLSTFDAPDAISACTRRIRSNTPLQALNLLNDTAWMEFSRALAARALKEVKDDSDEARITYAFRLASSRIPSADEREVLTRMLERKRREFRDQPQTADAIVGSATPPKRASKTDFAAWTLVARAILNLDETITRE